MHVADWGWFSIEIVDWSLGASRFTSLRDYCIGSRDPCNETKVNSLINDPGEWDVGLIQSLLHPIVACKVM